MQIFVFPRRLDDVTDCRRECVMLGGGDTIGDKGGKVRVCSSPGGTANGAHTPQKGLHQNQVRVVRQCCTGVCTR